MNDNVEKTEKYHLLREEIVNVWHMIKVIVVTVVIGALGFVSVNSQSYLAGKKSLSDHLTP